MARDRVDRLAAGFRICGEAEMDLGEDPLTHKPRYPSPACVQLKRPGMERLELTPDEADDLAEALTAEAAFARGGA